MRGPGFDRLFILGPAGLALLAGTVIGARPDLFKPLLVANVWLLSYQHVIATYTRLAFDRESFRQHRFLVLGVPVLVFLGVVGVVELVGFWAVFSTYLYWQWFHYTRQSYGIEQIYWRKSDPGGGRRDRATWCVIYLLPLWGILHRSVEAQPTFLGKAIWYFPVPVWLEATVGTLAVGSAIWWAAQRALEAHRGELRLAHTLYVVSHAAVFVTGYLIIASIDVGWLVLNIWHNGQYLLVVWMFHTSRFKGGVDAKHRLLSTMSQPDRVLLYVAVCGVTTVLFYNGLELLAVLFGIQGITAAALIYQTLNFHHYISDAVIWKLRKPAIRAQVGVPTAPPGPAFTRARLVPTAAAHDGGAP
jgi:hypothetical protein